MSSNVPLLGANKDKSEKGKTHFSNCHGNVLLNMCVSFLAFRILMNVFIFS